MRRVNILLIIGVAIFLALLVGLYVKSSVVGFDSPYGGSVEEVDSHIDQEIAKLYLDTGSDIALIPSSKSISVKKGDSGGFAFVFRNDGNSSAVYKYVVKAEAQFDYEEKCGEGINGFLAAMIIENKLGTFDVPSGEMIEPELVSFNIPSDFPECTIPYRLIVESDSGMFVEERIYLTIKK